MLVWRLVLGVLLVAIVVGLCWLDHAAPVPGIWLLPAAVLLTVMAGGEVLQLIRAAGLQPSEWPVCVGNVLLVGSGWATWALGQGERGAGPDGAACWTLLTFVAAVLLVLVAEIRRYEGPGGVTANVAAAVLALVYVGLMFSFVVQLRMAWGIAGLASLLIVVKMSDTGAYTVGRLWGRHKLAPTLSPGKTVEGALGGLAFACLGAWATFGWLVPSLAEQSSGPAPWWGWISFALLLNIAGLLGDLAESLIKRDAGRKDSSSWVPGFGGVVDLLDSVLLAAPVAWACWAAGLVGV